MRPCGVARVGYAAGASRHPRRTPDAPSQPCYRPTNVNNVASGGHANRTGV